MKKLILSILLILSISVQSQDLDDVFDDGGYSNIKNNVTLSVSDLIEGFINVGYNRNVGDNSTLGFTIGFYLFSGQPLHLNIGEEQSYFTKLEKFTYDKGFMFRFQYRFFFIDYDGLYMQYGFLYNSRKTAASTYTFIGAPELKMGYTWRFLNQFHLNVSGGFGFGFHFVNKPQVNISILDLDNLSIYLPLNLEIGYEF